MNTVVTTQPRESARFASAADMLVALAPREPVYCLYPHRVAAAVHRFDAGFPGRTLYAVKVNAEPMVLRALHRAGIRHFDTASLTEIALVRGLFPDATCYYMAPVRPIGAVATAYHQHGVRHFAVDCAKELETLRQAAQAPGETTLYVRLMTPPKGVTFELSSKFGTSVTEAARLMERASGYGFRVGLTFHVGSQCLEPEAYSRALCLVGETLARSPVPLAALDVGGGYPAPYPGSRAAPLEAHLGKIRELIADLHLPADAAVLAEPGRALVADGVSLVAQVMLRRDDRIYLNDGVYGTFAEPKISHGAVRFPARAMRLQDGVVRPLGGAPMPLTVFGPTCDAYDVLPEPQSLPADIDTGDYIEFGLTGAYAQSMRTAFNGFYPDRMVEIGTGSEPPLE